MAIDNIDLTSPDPTTLVVEEFSPTSNGFAVRFSEPIDGNRINLYSLDAPDLILQDPDGPVDGSLVLAPDDMGFRFVASAVALPVGDYTLTIRSGDDAFKTLDGTWLDGDSVSGGDFQATFDVEDAGDVVELSLPHVVRGPGQSIELHIGVSGLPVQIGGAGGVDRVAFELVYDPSLLVIDGAALGESVPEDCSLAIDLGTPGRIPIIVEGTSGLTSGVFDLIRLDSRVSEDAFLTSKHVIDIQFLNVEEAGQTVIARDVDAIHMASYIGDAFVADSSYSIQDVADLIETVLGSPLVDYPNVDPVLVADLNGNGVVDLDDATTILQASLGIPISGLPPRPAIEPPIPSGLDPLLAIGTVQAEPGETVAVPLLLTNTDRATVGVQTIQTVIEFDAQAVTIRDVQLGDLGQNYRMFWHVNVEKGLLILVGYRREPLAMAPNFGGELAHIELSLSDALTVGDEVVLNLRSNVATPMGTIATGLNGSTLVLIPAPTNAWDDPIDGRIEIVEHIVNESRMTQADPTGLSVNVGSVSSLDWILRRLALLSDAWDDSGSLEFLDDDEKG